MPIHPLDHGPASDRAAKRGRAMTRELIGIAVMASVAAVILLWVLSAAIPQATPSLSASPAKIAPAPPPWTVTSAPVSSSEPSAAAEPEEAATAPVENPPIEDPTAIDSSAHSAEPSASHPPSTNTTANPPPEWGLARPATSSTSAEEDVSSYLFPFPNWSPAAGNTAASMATASARPQSAASAQASTTATAPKAPATPPPLVTPTTPPGVVTAPGKPASETLDPRF